MDDSLLNNFLDNTMDRYSKYNADLYNTSQQLNNLNDTNSNLHFQSQMNSNNLINNFSIKEAFTYNNRESQFNHFETQNNFRTQNSYHYNSFNNTQNFSNTSTCYGNITTQYSINLREEKELQTRLNIIKKIELLFKQIIQSLKNNNKLEIYVVDIDKNSQFNYDYGYYALPQTNKDLKYKTLDLYSNSERIARLTKVCSIIHNKLLKNRGTNRRELYYNDVELFKSTDILDNVLVDICSIFNQSRFDICVFTSPKGLFAGDLIITDQFNKLLSSNKHFEKSNLIGYEYYLEEIKIISNARFILVVEKETIFFNLINSSLYTQAFANSIVITAKGYADYMSKFLIKRLSDSLNIPILYFGDFDPFGIEIYLNYIFGSRTTARENDIIVTNNINWIGLNIETIEMLKSMQNISQNLINLSELDFKKIEFLLDKEYFNSKGWLLSVNENKETILNNLDLIREQLLFMQNNKFKAEAELIISNNIELFIDYLNCYLSTIL